MKNSIFAGLMIALLLWSSSVFAGAWICRDASGNSACYVTRVRLVVSDSSSNKPYVEAQLQTEPGQEGIKSGCNYIRVQRGYAYASTDTVRAAEAVMITALTTGLPVRFVNYQKSGQTCWTNSMIISKPGH